MRARCIAAGAVALLLLLVAWGQTGRAQSNGGVWIVVEPDIAWVTPGERVTVELVARGVPSPGLAAFEVSLRYDPEHFDVVDPNAGYPSLKPFAPLGGSPLCAFVRRTAECPERPWMLTATSRKAVGAARVDPDEGLVSIAYGTMGDSGLPTGDGTLAVVELVGRSNGPVHLFIEKAILADASEPPVRYDWTRLPR